MNVRLINEAALSIARKALGVVRPLLMDMEAGDAFKEFFDIATKELRHYAAEAERMERRLRPAGGDHARTADQGGGV